VTIPEPGSGYAGPIAARAKINLYLHVTGRRDDGYHLLDSLFVRIDLADRIWWRPAHTDRLQVTGPFAAALSADAAGDNLVLKAVESVRCATGGTFCAEIVLEKNIPAAAGLGGGSADAAAMLKTFAAEFGGSIELDRLALALGADVPPCLVETPVLASGIGEILTPVPALPDFGVVLVNPGVPVSTPAVFRRRTGRFSEAMPWDGSPRDIASLVAALAQRRNDLEEPAWLEAPVIGRVLEALEAEPDLLLARMSGSGATCFGITEGPEKAQALAAAIAQRHPDWWTYGGAAVTVV